MGLIRHRTGVGMLFPNFDLSPSLIWTGEHALYNAATQEIGSITQTTAGLGEVDTEAGRGLTGIGKGGARLDMPGVVFSNGDLTVVFRGRPTNEAYRQDGIYQSGSAGFGGLHFNTDQNFAVVAGQMSLTLLQTHVNRSSIKAPNTIDGALHTWVVRKQEGAHAVWRDGVPQTIATTGTLTGLPFTTTDAVSMFGATSFSALVQGPMLLVAVFNHAFNDAISQRMSEDAESVIFAPRQIWVPCSAASVAPTLSDLNATNVTANSVQFTYDYAF